MSHLSDFQTGKTPFFRISATPVSPRSNLINIDSSKLKKLLELPPGSRRNGWNMDLSMYFPKARFSEGIRVGEMDSTHLEVFESGYSEFLALLDQHFCYTQSDAEFKRQPRLYQYAVTEYPTTFLELYRELVNSFSINDEIIIRLEFRNLRGYSLLPGAPGDISAAYRSPSLFEAEHLLLPPETVSSNFEPDLVAYELIKKVYAAFGFDDEAIPFFNSQAKRFFFQT